MQEKTPEDVARAFYDAFTSHDGDRMASLYSDDISFSDPIFPGLVGRDARAMWQMLCKRAPDLKVDYEVLKVEGQSVTVRWDAHYTFATTGRHVHNIVQATLEIRDGLIHQHTDRFSFWWWSAQALGPVGFFFGWSGVLKSKVQAQGRMSLDKFLA
ncbi:MAG: hypothetical protein RIQ81_1979 [Pseudomonadota bacterium]|jgi:ketosteroid isomerase-like protein